MVGGGGGGVGDAFYSSSCVACSAVQGGVSPPAPCPGRDLDTSPPNRYPPESVSGAGSRLQPPPSPLSPLQDEEESELEVELEVGSLEVDLLRLWGPRAVNTAWMMQPTTGTVMALPHPCAT